MNKPFKVTNYDKNGKVIDLTKINLNEVAPDLVKQISYILNGGVR